MKMKKEMKKKLIKVAVNVLKYAVTAILGALGFNVIN